MKNTILQTALDSSGAIKSWASTTKFWVTRNLHQELQWITSQAPWALTLGEKIFCIKNDISEEPRCRGCGAHTAFKMSKGYATFCSRRCTQQDPSSKEQRQSKKNATILSKYGVTNISLLDSTKEKISRALSGIKRGPVPNHRTRQHLPSDVASLLAAPLELKEWFEQSQLPITAAAHELGLSSATIHNIFKRNGVSYSLPPKTCVERKIADLCVELSETTTLNNRKLIAPLELDVLIPEYRVALEVNGLFWHSTKAKGTGYHLNKHELVAERDFGSYNSGMWRSTTDGQS